MKLDRHVAAPPPKPLMIFDGDCGFCALWIRRWQQAAGDRIAYVPFQDPRVTQEFPEVPRANLESAVHLIEPDGTVLFGAEAAFAALAHNPEQERWRRWYRNSPAFARFTEAAYRFVAGHRRLFSWLTRIGWGRQVQRPAHCVTRWLFLRALGAIYLVAFLSLGSQLGGLVGRNGILPAAELMSAAGQHFDAQGVGLDRYRQFPTLCWANASDAFLNFQCAAGVGLALLVLAGLAPAPCLFLLWLIYLSLSVVGREFLGFQWDVLLLETGLLAIFFAPRNVLPGWRRETPPGRMFLWLLRWLLFRLMFQSGVTKLIYDDPTWREWTALTFHYETQPLPTWLGWYAHQLPVWFQRFSCGVMYFTELVLPFLFFAPRRLRIVAAAGTVLLQLLIALTGNYTFFNLLTVVLCLPLLDDFALQKITPPAWRRFFGFNRQPATFNVQPSKWRTRTARVFAAVVILITTIQMSFNLRIPFPWPKAALQLTDAVAPLRSLSSYGLFRVMTRPRFEIIVEGSNDGVTWLPYEFKWKPGDVKRRPGFVAPHQPRLDWQMWFEALRPPEAGPSPWFGSFCVRLLQGSPEVLALLAKNPFPDQPPRLLRAIRYEYHFTNPAERQQTGAWWKRERRDEYLPPFPNR